MSRACDFLKQTQIGFLNKKSDFLKIKSAILDDENDGLRKEIDLLRKENQKYELMKKIVDEMVKNQAVVKKSLATNVGGQEENSKGEDVDLDQFIDATLAKCEEGSERPRKKIRVA